ncbi:MAG: DHH family phosphoesterase [Candidatus Hodarchaeaceae archaeon]|nr:DHH family phosphoesterase [Candidatus Hodarchaeaceae archaeon]
MNYAEQVQQLFETDPGFASAVGMLEKLSQRKHPRVLNFSHHDLDGITSAFIAKRLLERQLGAEVVVKLPSHFKLWEEALVEVLEKEGKFDLLLLTDKGTFSFYDDFLKHVDQVLIIDHHQLDGMPKRCTVFNPTVEISEYASAASLLCHMLATKLGPTDVYDDFAVLLGCRGDFAFDPVQKSYTDFARPFIEQSMEEFPLAFRFKADRPTMYDLVDRERTVLVNQLAEVLHAGCLAHLYNQVLGTDIPYGPELVYDFLFELSERGARPEKFSSVNDMLGGGPKSRILSRVFDMYKSDWALLSGRVENAVFLGEICGVGVYMVFAEETEAMRAAPFPAILPFVASTRMDALKRAGGHPHSMIIIFCPKERGVHISMRGGGGVIDCGSMCSQLATRLRELYPGQEGVGGGGHARAAECLADKPVPMYAVMHELISMVQEMVRLAEVLDRGKATLEEMERARSLGLTHGS